MKNKKLSKEKSAMNNHANVCTMLMRYFGPQVLFCTIWNKGFWDLAHLTDGMQRQKKSKKHTYLCILYFGSVL